MAKKTGKTGKTAKKPAAPKKAKQKNTDVPVAPGPAPRQLKTRPQLPNVWQLTKVAWEMIWRHRKLFFGITLIYGLLNLLLVQGLASHTDVTTLKDSIDKAFSGELSSVTSSLGVFVVLLSSAGNGSSQTAGSYQIVLWLVTSLAVIWALRHVAAGTLVRIRDAYYRGMYPLIPFILVLIMIGVQLLPVLIGSTLYSIVMTNGITAHFYEQLIWLAILVLSVLISLYFISSSVFALYIVTLPDMTPLKALRSAKGLVRGRRWTVARKLLFLPLLLLVAAAIIMVPIIILLTPAAQWVFFLLTMFSLVVFHAYMYTLYRELLNE